MNIICRIIKLSSPRVELSATPPPQRLGKESRKNPQKIGNLNSCNLYSAKFGNTKQLLQENDFN